MNDNEFHSLENAFKDIMMQYIGGCESMGLDSREQVESIFDEIIEEN